MGSSPARSVESNSEGKPRLSPASIRERTIRQARAAIDRILRDYDVTLAEALSCDRTDPVAIQVGHMVPAIRVRDARLLLMASELEQAAHAHHARQATRPEGERRGAQHRYLVRVHVPPSAGRLAVEVEDLTPPDGA